MFEYKKIALPTKPKIISESDTKGEYVIEDLYPGYGYTLGNSLRRVLLSSIPGCAITEIRIKNVSNEFSVIKGLQEDVLSFVLNLKGVRFRLTTEANEQLITLDKKGIGKVSASDFKLPTQVAIANGDHYLGEITDSALTLSVEAKVERGIGFLSRDAGDESRAVIGTIIPDVMFSPVKRVIYEVEDMRVGSRTDFNRLTMTIQTDGSITPKEALESAMETMISQLKSLIGFRSTELNKSDTQQTVAIGDAEFSPSIKESLMEAGINTVQDLGGKTAEEVLACKGIGEKTLQEIRDIAASYGVVLKE